MMSIALSEAEIEVHLEQVRQSSDQLDITVGCINSPHNVTVTGSEASIDALKTRLNDLQIFARKLTVPVAYHSLQMNEVANDYCEALRTAGLPLLEQTSTKEAPIFFSSVTGSRVGTSELADPEYWVRNLVSKFCFSNALVEMNKSSSISIRGSSSAPLIFIEIGPHNTLARPIKETLDGSSVSILYTLRRGLLSDKIMKELAGRLLALGCPVDVAAVNASSFSESSPNMLIDLPGYPFNHSQSYWLKSRLSRNRRFRGNPRHELLGFPSSDWNAQEAHWRFTIRLVDLPWIEHHIMDDSRLYPAAGMLVMVIEAARQLCDTLPIIGYRLKDVIIHHAILVPEHDDGVETQLFMRAQSNTAPGGKPSYRWQFRIYFVEREEFRLACSGLISTDVASPAEVVTTPDSSQFELRDQKLTSEQVRDRCTTALSSEKFYGAVRRLGAQFGPSFRTLHDISFDPKSRDHHGAHRASPMP